MSVVEMAIIEFNEERKVYSTYDICVCVILEELRRRAAFFSNPPQGLSFCS